MLKASNRVQTFFADFLTAHLNGRTLRLKEKEHENAVSQTLARNRGDGITEDHGDMEAQQRNREHAGRPTACARPPRLLLLADPVHGGAAARADGAGAGAGATEGSFG
jgi:hypothetical protein